MNVFEMKFDPVVYFFYGQLYTIVQTIQVFHNGTRLYHGYVI